MGRSLRSSLFNLGLQDVARDVLAEADIKIDNIYAQEPDAGLGNGGLGRLAACYLDGMATDCIPGTVIRSCMSMASSSRRLWTAGSRKPRITGSPAVRSGSNRTGPGTGNPL